MLLYEGSTEQFTELVEKNKLFSYMEERFLARFGRNPSPGEVYSWQNSLSRVRDLISIAGLTNNMIALEYEIPYNQRRIDCFLFGQDAKGLSNIILIELKQWSKVTALPETGNFQEKYEVETYVGRANRIVAHPSQQTKGYHNYLKNFIAEFEKPPLLSLFSCAYCHNYKQEEKKGLFHPVYAKLIEEFPIYTQADTVKLAKKIKTLLDNGNGFEIFNRFMQSPLRPSRRLSDSVVEIVKNKPVFSLINEQLVAKNMIWSRIRKGKQANKGSVIIVHGGPGTGKSVIAINILAEAAKQRLNVLYGCKSKPFIEGLKKMVGAEAKLLFTNLYRFIPSKCKKDEFGLVLVDEAHRIGKKSNYQFTKPNDRTDMPQIEQLIRCARTAVFFIDDKQSVRSREVGSSQIIRDAAKTLERNLFETELYTQFRCMGSNDYLQWLEHVLGYSDEQKKLKKSDLFDFKIFDSPKELYETIKEKDKDKKNSARLVAGFCWPWSNTLDENGNLINDVKIGNFAMPWETHGNVRPPPGYVKWYEWAYKSEGIKQVGCIYTAQGFEYDYIGVIVGPDLIYDFENKKLATDITATKDPTLRGKAADFDNYVRNIYRVLMSRGLKGCYVYFVNKETERYFKQKMEI